MKTRSLFLSSWLLSVLLLLDCPSQTSSLENQHDLTNDDYGDVSIEPLLRLHVLGTSETLSDDGKDSVVRAVTDFAKERMSSFYQTQYSAPPDEYLFQTVVFNAISVEGFTVVEGAGGTRTRRNTKQRRQSMMRVFEREEAEVELDMHEQNIGNINSNTKEIEDNISTTLLRGNDNNRALEGDGERYGTSFLFNGTISFEYTPAPPEVIKEGLSKVMDSKWLLFQAIRALEHPELEDLSRTSDLIWEVVTPEPTTSPVPSSSLAPSPASSPKPTVATPTPSAQTPPPTHIRFELDLDVNVIVSAGGSIETVKEKVGQSFVQVLDETSEELDYDVTFVSHDVIARAACVNVNPDIIQEGQSCHFFEMSAIGRPNEDVGTSYGTLIAEYKERLNEIVLDGGFDGACEDDTCAYFVVAESLQDVEKKDRDIVTPISVSLSVAVVAALAIGLKKRRFRSISNRSPQTEQYMEKDDVEVLFPIPNVPKEEEELMMLDADTDSWEVTKTMDDS